MFLPRLSALLGLISCITCVYAQLVVENCAEHEQRQITDGAYRVLQILNEVQPVMERASTGANRKYPASIITPAQGDDLIRRWFGESMWVDRNQVSTKQKAEDYLGYVAGVFDRMHELVSSWNLTIRCMDDKFAGCDRFEPTWRGPQWDDFQNARVVDPNPRIGLCPQALTWPDAFVNGFFKDPGMSRYIDANLEGPDDRSRAELISYTSLPHLIVHELARYNDIGQHKIIHRVDVTPNEASKDELWGRHAYWLGFKATYLALHNADNYASFATDVALLAQGMRLPKIKWKPRVLATTTMKAIAQTLGIRDDYQWTVSTSSLPKPTRSTEYDVPTITPLTMPASKLTAMRISGMLTTVKAPPTLTTKKRDVAPTPLV